MKHIVTLVLIIILLNSFINYSNTQIINEEDEDPCKDLKLREPIQKKKDKIFYAYVRPPYCSNYTYFSKDPSFKWSNIDVIATYNVNYDKRISCLAHKNGVRVEFILEEGHFCSKNEVDDQCPYYENNIDLSLPKIMDTLQSNYVDGISLDFEYNKNGNKYGRNGGYAFLSKKIKSYFNSINANYSLSSALAMSPNSNLKKQMVDIAKNHDYLVVMCYDLYGYPAGGSTTKSPVTSISIRNRLKSEYINRLKDKELINKVIVALPLYGYGKRCKKDSMGIFTNNCINADNEKPLSLGVNSIHHYITSPDYISSGIFWREESKTVYSNVQINGDIYQIVYDTPFSTYQKLKDIGLGGSGVWAIDHLIGLPQPLVEAYYVTFETINIGEKFINNLPSYNR